LTPRYFFFVVFVLFVMNMQFVFKGKTHHKGHEGHKEKKKENFVF